MNIHTPLDEHTPDVCRAANDTRACPYNDEWHPPHKTADDEADCRCTLVADDPIGVQEMCDILDGPEKERPDIQGATLTEGTLVYLKEALPDDRYNIDRQIRKGQIGQVTGERFGAPGWVWVQWYFGECDEAAQAHTLEELVEVL